jgi:SAM domain (Sterile alpha motif)
VPAMQQIADWLKKIDMPEHTDRFVENRIDISVLAVVGCVNSRIVPNPEHNSLLNLNFGLTPCEILTIVKN